MPRDPSARLTQRSDGASQKCVTMRHGAREDRPAFTFPIRSTPQSQSVKMGARRPTPRLVAEVGGVLAPGSLLVISDSPGSLRLLGSFGISSDVGPRGVCMRLMARTGGQQRCGNHWALTLFSAGPCDRGNLCPRRPGGKGGGPGTKRGNGAGGEKGGRSGKELGIRAAAATRKNPGAGARVEGFLPAQSMILTDHRTTFKALAVRPGADRGAELVRGRLHVGREHASGRALEGSPR
jgi:hypothetical protein